MMVGIAFQCSDAWLAIYLSNNTCGITSSYHCDNFGFHRFESSNKALLMTLAFESWESLAIFQMYVFLIFAKYYSAVEIYIARIIQCQCTYSLDQWKNQQIIWMLD